jgi:hypothetical protein
MYLLLYIIVQFYSKPTHFWTHMFIWNIFFFLMLITHSWCLSKHFRYTMYSTIQQIIPAQTPESHEYFRKKPNQSEVSFVIIWRTDSFVRLNCVKTPIQEDLRFDKCKLQNSIDILYTTPVLTGNFKRFKINKIIREFKKFLFAATF